MQHLKDHEPAESVNLLEALLSQDAAIEPTGEMLVRGVLASAYLATGRVDEAKAASERALKLSQEIGDEEGQNHYQGLLQQITSMTMDDAAIDDLFNRAEDAHNRGDFEATEAALNTLLIAALAQNLTDVEASVRGMLGETYLERGAIDDARIQLGRAIELAQAMQEPAAEAHFTRLLEAAQNPEEATKFKLEAALAQKADQAQNEALIAMEKGEFEVVLALLEPLADEAQAAEAAPIEANVRAMVAQSLLMQNRHADAEKQARRALELARQLGSQEAVEGFEQLLKLCIGWTSPIEKA